MPRCPSCSGSEIFFHPEGDVTCGNFEVCGGWGGSYIELLDSEGGFEEVLPFLRHVGKLEAPRKVRRHAWPEGVYLQNVAGDIVQVGHHPAGAVPLLGRELFARDWYLLPE